MPRRSSNQIFIRETYDLSRRCTHRFDGSGIRSHSPDARRAGLRPGRRRRLYQRSPKAGLQRVSRPDRRRIRSRQGADRGRAWLDRDRQPADRRRREGQPAVRGNRPLVQGRRAERERAGRVEHAGRRTVLDRTRGPRAGEQPDAAQGDRARLHGPRLGGRARLSYRERRAGAHAGRRHVAVRAAAARRAQRGRRRPVHTARRCAPCAATAVAGRYRATLRRALHHPRAVPVARRPRRATTRT